MKLFKVNYEVAAPGALIGASNFFELAIATAIALYGPASGAELATVVVLVEVPVMLPVCRMCVSTRYWFESEEPVATALARSIASQRRPEMQQVRIPCTHNSARS